MIAAKVEHLFEGGRIFEGRTFAALRRRFMFGLEHTQAMAADVAVSGIDGAREMFRWRDDATEKEETRRTGVGLMFWSAMAGNAEAVRALAADEATNHPNHSLSVFYPMLFSIGQLGNTALHVATVSSDWATMEALLEAGADPHAKSTAQGNNAIMLAVMMAFPPEKAKIGAAADGERRRWLTRRFGSEQREIRIVMLWSQRFPEWNWDQRDTGTGLTPLLYAAQFGPDKLHVIKALIKVGADPTVCSSTGQHLLICAAANLDTSPECAKYLLNISGVREMVNMPMVCTTKKWKAQMKLLRLLVWLGSKNTLFKVVTSWDRLTPLGSAAQNGNAAVMHVLSTEGGANRLARNAQGHTPLDLARRTNGDPAYYNPLLATQTPTTAIEDSTLQDTGKT